MRYRALDSGGDYTFGGGQASLKRDQDAVAQAVKTRLLLFLGEWWEDRSDGLPGFEEMLGKRASGADGMARVAAARIAGTRGVTGVSGVRADAEDGRLRVTCAVQTVYGQIQLDEVIP